VINSSRRLYAGNRQKIEADIVAWMFDSADETKKKREKNRRKKEKKKENEYEKRTGKKAPWAKPRGPAYTTPRAGKPEQDTSDLPGTNNFKDAFALALQGTGQALGDKPKKEQPLVPDSVKKDTKTYGVGDGSKTQKK